MDVGSITTFLSTAFAIAAISVSDVASMEKVKGLSVIGAAIASLLISDNKSIRF